MYKILVIFIIFVITTCLAEKRLYRFRNKRIQYEDDDYREDNADDERTDLRDMRDMRNNNDHPLSHQNPYELNRPSYFDVGPRYRGLPYGVYNQYNPAHQPASLYPQLQQQQQQYQPQPQQSHLPTQQPQSLDSGRNPHGWTRPAYGWPRPAPSTGWSFGFPFNLFGLGSHRPGPEWGWGGSRWGLFF